MQGKDILWLIASLIFFGGCGNGPEVMESNTSDIVMVSPIEVTTTAPVFNPSEAKVNDIIHTRLDVTFDWEKHHLLGVATIEAKPYFYPAKELMLDAKGFDLHRVALVTDEGYVDLDYDYDNWVLRIQLDKTYSSIETYTIRIEYTAKPDDLPIGGSEAILADKGLYFINTDSTEVGKPTQIWTQGQTESSSCWFPTIDSPNERMTQELFITVMEKYRTLSNGEHVYSNYNADGTRTDYWNMPQSHPPYLAMMAVGDFVVAHDSWTNSKGEEIPVNYYLEPEYGPYAYLIFGNTPEMMTFYSDLLDYDYPWPKYSQVVVRDYVSGAMENTTATIHGEFLNATDRELLDYNNEDIIAHELFHHWFGDLVTCESWANLALNESFATYGEYLWSEYKYGRDEAGMTLSYFESGYLNEARHKKEKLIRYYYDDKEDMFDAHTYEKGACILHMLRDLVGDRAFFESLSQYVKRHAYKDAEVHNLRLIFEETTGLDLQWFFDQWFLGSGHPELEISYDLVDNKPAIIVNQHQSSDKPFYLLVDIDVHRGEEIERLRVDLSTWSDSIYLKSGTAITWINFDPNQVILGEIENRIPESWYLFAADTANHVLSRIGAFDYFSDLDSVDAAGYSAWEAIFKRALASEFYEVQVLALENLALLKNPDEFRSDIESLLVHENSNTAAMAYRILGQDYSSESHISKFYEGLKSRSYLVMSEALLALARRDNKLGLAEAEKLKVETSLTLLKSVYRVFALYGDSGYQSYFETEITKANGYKKYLLLDYYGLFLARQDQKVQLPGMKFLQKINESGEYMAIYGVNRAIKSIVASFPVETDDEPTPEQVEMNRIISILIPK